LEYKIVIVVSVILSVADAFPMVPRLSALPVYCLFFR